MARKQRLSETECTCVPEDELSELATSVPPNELDGNQKRWLVVGISLHSVISPMLRDTIPPVVERQYDILVKSNYIDRQLFTNYVKKHPATSTYELNYKSINNNSEEPRGRRFYDYKVKNSVDYSKLFLLPHMARYTGFDETCDSSALLGILLKVDGFAPDVKQNAKETLQFTRNPWAHCNFSEWDDRKYEKSFKIMNDFIKSLNLEKNKDIEIRRKLSDWEENGKDFCIGRTFDHQFVESVKRHARNLQLLISNIAEHTDDRLNEVKSELDKVQRNLNTAVERLENVERQLQDHEIRIEGLEEKVKRSKLSTGVIEYFNPPNRKETFTGRSWYLERLKNILLNNKHEDQFKVTLCGLGGVGKTSLATEYAWRNRDSYSGGVFWLSGETNESFENSLCRLASKTDMLRSKVQETVSEIFNWLSNLSKQTLIIVDNVDDKDSGSRKEFILNRNFSNFCHHMIITSRLGKSQATEHLDCKISLNIEKLQPHESFEFLKKRIQLEDETQDEDIKNLCKELDGLPLALEQASLMIKNVEYSVHEYINEFKKAKTDLLRDEPAPNLSNVQDDDRLCVSTTWSMNFKQIEKRSKQSRFHLEVKLLTDILSCCAGEDIPIALLNEGEPVIASLDLSSSTVRRIINILTEYSLVTRNNESLTMHKLVQAVVRKTFEADVERKNKILLCAVKMMLKALQTYREGDDSMFGQFLCIERQCGALRSSLQVSDNRIFSLFVELLKFLRVSNFGYSL